MSTSQRSPPCKIFDNHRVSSRIHICLLSDVQDCAGSLHNNCRLCGILLFAVKPYIPPIHTYEKDALRLRVFNESHGSYNSVLKCSLLRFTTETSFLTTGGIVIATVEISTETGMLSHRKPSTLVHTPRLSISLHHPERYHVREYRLRSCCAARH
jgi:hypothetical protein